MRGAFVKAPVLLALISAVSIVAVAGCGGSETPTVPTPPTPATAPADPVAPVAPPSVTGVTPSAPTRSDTAQRLTVVGLGFRPGASLDVTAPSGASVTIPAADIPGLVPTSFDVSVVLSESGVYTLVVRQMDAAASAPFRLTVREAAAPMPQIDSVSPSTTPPDVVALVVSLVGRDFHPALVVQVVDPDSTLHQLNQSNLLLMTDSLIQFSMMFDRVGDYTISLWDDLGLASNVVILRVR